MYIGYKSVKNAVGGVVVDSIQVTAFTDEGGGEPHVPDWQPSDSPFNVIIITEDIGCQ